MPGNAAMDQPRLPDGAGGRCATWHSTAELDEGDRTLRSFRRCPSQLRTTEYRNRGDPSSPLANDHLCPRVAFARTSSNLAPSEEHSGSSCATAVAASRLHQHDERTRGEREGT